jgi:hypothetical protein
LQASTGFGVRGTLARPVPGALMRTTGTTPVQTAPSPTMPATMTPFGVHGTLARPVLMGGSGTGIGAPVSTGATTQGGAAPVIEGAAVTASPAVVASPGASCPPPTTPSLIDIPGISTSLIVGAAVVVALGIYLMETGRI